MEEHVNKQIGNVNTDAEEEYNGSCKNKRHI